MSPAGDRNELTIEEDGGGEATIYFFLDNVSYYADFSSEWVEDGDRFEIDMECDGNCGPLDFTMECEMKNGDEEMHCEGDDGWRDYELEWERE